MSVIDIIAKFRAEGTAQAKDLAQSITGIDKSAATANTSVGGLGKVMQFGLAAGAGVAVAGVGLLAKGLFDSVIAAADAQQVQAQLAAVLESTGGAAGLTAEEVNKIASSLAEVTTFGDDAILTGQNLLLTFTGIGEDVFPRATETMLDMATALGTDAAGSAIQLGKALNDPIQGITALTRVGVSFSTEQKEMIRTLQESGDLMGAQTIILDELAKEFGGSAAAAAQTFTGRMTQLKDRLGEVQEEIGGAFLPALTTLAEEAIPALQEAAAELVPVIQELAAEELPALVDSAKDVIGALPEMVSTLIAVGDAMEDIQKISPQYWFSQLGKAVIDAAGELAEVDNRIKETTTVTGIYGQEIEVNTVALEGHTRELLAEGNAYDYLIPRVEEVTTSTRVLTGAYDYMIQASIINENRMEHYGERLGEVTAEQEAADRAAKEWANTLNGIVSGALNNQIGNLEELDDAYGDLEAATGEWVTTTINNNGRIATANEALMADLSEETKKGYQEILNTAAEGGAEWLAAYEALQGDLTESQRQALIAQIADLQAHQGETATIYTGDSEAAEEARNRINAALAEIATGYKTMVLDMIIADAGGVFTEEAAEFAIGAGIMTSSQAAVRLEMQRLTTVEFPQLLQFQRDGKLTAGELGVATDLLATSQATSAESAMLQASETGILAGKLGEAYTQTVNLKDALLATAGDYDVNLNYNISTSGSIPEVPGLPASGGGLPAPIPQASGGDWWVTSPTLFLAGEAGPERATFTPLRNGVSQIGGGGNTTNYYISIDARGAAPGVERQIVQSVDYVMQQHTRTQDGQTRMR